MFDRNKSTVFLGIFVGLWFLGNIIILAGFIEESIQNNGYVIQVCKVSNSTIIQNKNSFNINIELQYLLGNLFLTKWLFIETCPTYQSAFDFILTNYPNNKYIPCYIARTGLSDISIKLNLYNQIYTVTAGVILFFISMGGCLVYVIVLGVFKCKKFNYENIPNKF